MTEDMHEYGVYADAVSIAFDEEELEDSVLNKLIMQMKIIHTHIEIWQMMNDNKSMQHCLSKVTVEG